MWEKMETFENFDIVYMGFQQGCLLIYFESYPHSVNFCKFSCGYWILPPTHFHMTISVLYLFFTNQYSVLKHEYSLIIKLQVIKVAAFWFASFFFKTRVNKTPPGSSPSNTRELRIVFASGCQLNLSELVAIFGAGATSRVVSSGCPGNK